MKGKLPFKLRKRHLFYLAIVVTFVYAVFGENGLIDVYRLRSERDGITAFNMALEEENRRLEEEIDLLKTDRRYIGRIARTELGMIGKDEVVYRIGAE